MATLNEMKLVAATDLVTRLRQELSEAETWRREADRAVQDERAKQFNYTGQLAGPKPVRPKRKATKKEKPHREKTDHELRNAIEGELAQQPTLSGHALAASRRRVTNLTNELESRTISPEDEA